jgi:hypothetical protein
LYWILISDISYEIDVNIKAPNKYLTIKLQCYEFVVFPEILQFLVIYYIKDIVIPLDAMKCNYILN